MSGESAHRDRVYEKNCDKQLGLSGVRVSFRHGGKTALDLIFNTAVRPQVIGNRLGLGAGDIVEHH